MKKWCAPERSFIDPTPLLMLPRLAADGIMPISKYVMHFLQVSWDFNVRSPSRRIRNSMVSSAITSRISRYTKKIFTQSTSVKAFPGWHTPPLLLMLMLLMITVGFGGKERLYDERSNRWQAIFCSLARCCGKCLILTNFYFILKKITRCASEQKIACQRLDHSSYSLSSPPKLMIIINNININSNGGVYHPGKALTEVDWVNIYLVYLDIIDVIADDTMKCPSRLIGKRTLKSHETYRKSITCFEMGMIPSAARHVNIRRGVGFFLGTR